MIRLRTYLLAAGLASASLIQGTHAGEQLNIEQLENLLIHDCGSCHGLTLKGGLGSDLRPETLAARDPTWLALVIRDGLPGTAMPPWGPLLSEEEIAWLVARLKRGR